MLIQAYIDRGLICLEGWTVVKVWFFGHSEHGGKQLTFSPYLGEYIFSYIRWKYPNWDNFSCLLDNAQPVCWFLKSAWRHSVYDYYDKARKTPYFASWHLGDSLGVHRWPQCRYKRRFYKSHSRLSKITTGYRCRNIRTKQNATIRNLIDPNKSGTWG